MKLKEFMQNPVGKGDSTYNRQLLIKALDTKYERLIKNKGELIKTKIYHELNTDNYYIHLVIPTETERDNTYDVVLYFYTNEHVNDSSLLKTHDIQFFCNSPSFVYTYAKLFSDKGLFIPWLKNKYPDEIFASFPEVRNRYGVTNYDKYLYIGCKYIYEMRLLHRTTLTAKSIDFSQIILGNQVRTLDRIIIQYKNAQDKLKQTKREHVRDILNKTNGVKVKSTKTNKPSVNMVKKLTGGNRTNPKSNMRKIKKI